jgi:L-ectoine synthase
MIVRQLSDIRKTDRLVKSTSWDSARLLLKNDGMGFSFHITTMYAGEDIKMHYQNHLEAVFVIEGTGTIEDLGTGETHKLGPGIMYALNKNDRHIVRPETDLVTACVFNPPVTGQEVHDENGAYPAEVDMPPQKAAVGS